MFEQVFERLMRAEYILILNEKKKEICKMYICICQIHMQANISKFFTIGIGNLEKMKPEHICIQVFLA